MNTIARLAVCSSVLLSSMAFGQGPMARPDWMPARIVKQDLPVFPYAMIQTGVRDGAVRVAFSVDATGRVDDCLAVAYSHPAFAQVALAAMKRWIFEPALMNGQPVAVFSEVTISFRTEGATVVSLTAGDYLAGLFYRLAPGAQGYRPRSVHELDGPPVPVVAPSPAYPREVAALRQGQVRVEFYIDETGSVRLPCADPTDDPELAALALNAVSHWRFQPPTVNGHPVLVRAVQVFNFGASRAAPPG